MSTRFRKKINEEIKLHNLHGIILIGKLKISNVFLLLLKLNKLHIIKPKNLKALLCSSSNNAKSNETLRFLISFVLLFVLSAVQMPIYTYIYFYYIKEMSEQPPGQKPIYAAESNTLIETDSNNQLYYLTVGTKRPIYEC